VYRLGLIGSPEPFWGFLSPRCEFIVGFPQ
jgi:hypothetical protein